MKKSFMLLPFLFLFGGCSEPEPELPPVNPEANSVKLTKTNCGLTNDTSISASTVSLDIADKKEKYEMEIGPNCYAHKTHEEFLIMKDGYIKSRSTYNVDRLVIDYMSKKLINFKVYDATNTEVAPHESSVPTQYPNEGDFGAVVEYPINGTSWKIANDTEYKPAFYSVTVYFTI